jgi:hypothetical protein
MSAVKIASMAVFAKLNPTDRFHDRFLGRRPKTSFRPKNDV